ncbi:Uncharacterised protein [Acinetobacter baumannii]|nr:Uncharacterised protein [Acinetobacter baumannii]
MAAKPYNADCPPTMNKPQPTAESASKATVGEIAKQQSENKIPR